MTNAEKFKEVFGVVPSTKYCPIVYLEDCKKCKGYFKYIGCCGSDWWNSEYKEKTDENS